MAIVATAALLLGVLSLMAGLALRLAARRRPVPGQIIRPLRILSSLRKATSFSELVLTLCSTGAGLALIGVMVLALHLWVPNLPSPLDDDRLFVVVLGLFFVSWAWSNGVAFTRVWWANRR